MLPHDELLAATVPLDPSAPDSTFAVHADGVMALSVERYLDELRLWHDLDPSHPFSWSARGRRWRRSFGEYSSSLKLGEQVRYQINVPSAGGLDRGRVQMHFLRYHPTYRKGGLPTRDGIRHEDAGRREELHAPRGEMSRNCSLSDRRR